MTQNTNSIAGLKLQANKSNNIGRIVEEHIRYWKKEKDQEEAKLLARRAREQEFNYKANNKALELYEGINPGDNKGFLNSQIISLYEKKKPEILELSRAIANGDSNAVLKYANLKENFKRLSKINEIYGKKGEEYAKNESNYNAILDEPIKNFRTSLGKGLYTLNDDFSISVAVEGKNELLKINSSSLLNNEYLQSSYSGKPKFKEYGLAVANRLLNTEDGQRVIDDKNTRNKGILQIKGIFEENNVEARSAYGVYVNSLKEKDLKDLTPFEKSLLKDQPKFSDLSSIQKTKIADDYYNRNVLPRILEVTKDTFNEDALDRARLDGQELLNTGRRIENQKKTEQLNQLKTKGKTGKRKKYKIEAQTDQTGRLAVTTNINGNDGVVYGGFKSFKVISKPEGTEKYLPEEEIEIEELILTDDGELSYREPSGKEGVDPEVIDRIVNYLGFKDVKSLFEEAKENRDSKKIDPDETIADAKNKKKTTTTNQNNFDPTNF